MSAINHPTKFELFNVRPSPTTEKEDVIEDATKGKHELQWIWSSFPPDKQRWSYDDHDQWTYIIDLDRDAFTVDSNIHFRLSNLPVDWHTHVDHDQTVVQGMPTSLDAAHLAWDVFPAIPAVDRDLLRIYDQMDVNIMEDPTPSTHVKNWIMLGLQNMFISNSSEEFTAQMKEWTPSDRRMQTWVYALIKCCAWECLSFEFARPNPFWRRFPEDGLNFLLKTADIPEQPEYLVPLPSGSKVLVSLATHLQVEDIARTAIAKVVDLIPKGSSQTACIVSSHEVIIVKVDKCSTRASVSHTKLLGFRDSTFSGVRALFTTFTPQISRLDTAAPNGSLPTELMLKIFKSLLLDVDGGFKAVPNLACTCKLFSAMVHDYTVYLPGLLFYSSPPSGFLPSFFRGWDIRSGRDQLYCIGPFNLVDFEKVREYKVFVDGANLGLMKLMVAPVDWTKLRKAFESIMLD